jgi:hypothetical protein
MGKDNNDRSLVEGDFAKAFGIVRKTIRTVDALCDLLPMLLKLFEDGAFGSLKGIPRKHRPVEPVAKILSVPNSDGSVKVIINDRLPVVLSPMLAALLLVLAQDDGRSDDDLVGWKNYEQISSGMESRTGKKLSLKALRQNVLRLRNFLENSGLDGGLIQTNKLERSYRFALRRKAFPLIDRFKS